MSSNSPDYLIREEPFRAPVEELNFWSSGECLARALANAKGFNSASDVTSESVTYGSDKIMDDGRRERLLGCRSCRAICTVVLSKRKELGPGTEDDPNIVISVSEAPNPNPWLMSGNFDDCKFGVLDVPEGAENLTKPQRQFSSPID